MFHAVYQIFKVYLRTLDIEHRIYRCKQNLLKLPYSPMITICSFSTVVICVKRSQIWSNGYCSCYMFHDFFVVFFSCLFLQFNYISISSTTSPGNGYCQLPCVVLSRHPYFLRYFPMESNADWFLCVYVEFLCVCAFSTPMSISPHSI